MRKTFVLSLCVIFALSLLAVGAYAKDTQKKLLQYNFTESPQEPVNAPEIGGSMFQAAAATTVVLGWYQFDNANGTPNKMGWTEWDITVQPKKYWHVAGTGCTDLITPIAGARSMWCGQWTSASAPWCGWSTLPGYGNGWDQSFESTVNVATIAYAIAWDSEPGYDYTYVEYYDPVNLVWVADPTAGGGAGGYTGNGSLVEGLTNTFGSTKARFHFQSDGAWSDEDGLWPTVQGGVTIDNVAINGGVAETYDAATCGATAVGSFTATIPPGFGEFGELYLGTGVVQEDPCLRLLSNMWGWFDQVTITSYACGSPSWPLQGAVRYGPDANGLYMLNEVWSPVIPITGLGNEYILSLLSYRDLDLTDLQFYVWHVRTQIGPTGCPTGWNDANFVYYGGQKDWIRTAFQVGAYVSAADTHIQVAVGAYDYCGVWAGLYGDCACHSHAPLIDQVKLYHVDSPGPQWTQRDIDLWHDNFPELGDVTPTSYARCDMAQDIILGTKQNLLPGDSLKIVVTDPNGLAVDNTGGRPGKAVYAFVRCTDRFGNLSAYTGAQMQSPDNQAWATDPNAGLIRWPLAAPALALPAGWYAYRMDQAYTSAGGVVKDTYCCDLMDLAAGPDGPPYHPNENWAANTGIFRPGDVIWYVFGALNTGGQWSFLSRDQHGQGAWIKSNDINVMIAETDPLPLPADLRPKAALEWSVLPDAGREPGDGGDILFVDDADDRGGPAQLYFDYAFAQYGIENRVDRFDVLGPSSVVGNSLAGRVKSIQNQIIGVPSEIYQKVFWNCSDLSRGLMGDGGTPNGGSSAEKSDDFGLAYSFLNTSTWGNPGWAYMGDDVVTDWAGLIGLGAVNTKGTYMNHGLTSGDQRGITGVNSPRVLPVSPLAAVPWLRPVESFYAYGGCAVINDFDVPSQTGNSRVAHKYGNAATGPNASLSQWTINSVGDTARFYLAGFAFNYVRDDDVITPPDYSPYFKELIEWFQNDLGDPIGIDPVAFVNNLEGNYPNPFNPTTTIKYGIAEQGHVSLKIYNAAGQLVRTLIDEEQAPQTGGFSKVWNGTNDRGQSVASGVYFYQLTAKNFSQTKKMVLLK